MRNPIRILCLVFLCFGGGLATRSAGAQEKLISDRVFHIPDPKSTSIQFQMIVLAGSADETNLAQLGIAHYLEHVVLVGRNAGNAESAFRFFPDGNSNGWTTQKMTGYVHNFPANSPDVPARLDRLFKFYSERLTDFAITPEDALRERNVVRQEHDLRYASNPFSQTWMDVSRYLYDGHPTALWTIGTPETIAAFTVDESRAFLKKWYRKGNVYFLVSGPLDGALVKAAAEKYLAALDPAPPPPRPWLKLQVDIKPENRVFRHAEKRITTPSFNFVRVVNVAEQDAVKAMAVARLVSIYLGSKLGGTPHSALVEGDAPVAAAISTAGLELPFAGALSLSIGAVPEEGRTLDDVQKEIQVYLDAFLQRGIDNAVLNRLKRRFARDYERNLAEPENAAGRLIGWLTNPLPYETIGDWPKAVAAVTVEDINGALAAFRGKGRDAVVIFENKAD